MRKIFTFVFILLLLGLLYFPTNYTFINDDFVNAVNIPQQNEYETNNLSPYNGKIYHIFFHSLILYPELAFKSTRAAGYDDWMVTRNEFKKILERLYQNNFVLTDIDYVREMKQRNTQIMFPKNKKILILSVDDVNYYEYMKNDGFAEKLIVDNNRRIATTVITPKGNRIVDYEGDVMPIVDSFVEKHPDFSFKGAKGIVAVTGYQGVFGYRINSLKNQEQTLSVSQAKEVANALKNNGWKIACHSYSHTNAFKDGGITFERFKKDLDKWNNIISPVTGKTNIYISPFGIQFANNDKRFKYLINNGFNIYCPVYKKMNVSFNGDCMISNRLNIDGFTLKKFPQRITSEFFDINNLIDKQRP